MRGTEMDTLARTDVRENGAMVIYHDGRMIGFVLDRCCCADAVTANGKTLGRYNSEPAAAAALLVNCTRWNIDRADGGSNG